MLEKELVDFIDLKAADLNEKEHVAKEVASIIEKLNNYIDERIELTIIEIDNLLKVLGGYFSTSLYISLSPSTRFLRVRIFDLNYLESKVSELSYIADSKTHLSSQGRFNIKGASIYYGCIYFNSNGGVNVGFSEVNAAANTSVNVLRSVNKYDLNIYYIGIYDFVHRECKPQFMSDEIFAKYCEVYNYQKRKFSPSAFLAHQICDTFFSDILRRTEHGNLYNVTSRLPEVFLKEDNIDGIIYTSVRAEGAPVVAIKSESIDIKFSHISCDAYEIVFDYGYAMYEARHTYAGCVSGENIFWSKNINKSF